MKKEIELQRQALKVTPWELMSLSMELMCEGIGKHHCVIVPIINKEGASDTWEFEPTKKV